jgi:hypothetical protein
MKAIRSVTPLAMAMLFSLATVQASAAQQLNAAGCREMLSAPTHDSIAVRVMMLVTSFDTASAITNDYRAIFVQAVRQELKLPQPLPVDMYYQYQTKMVNGFLTGPMSVGPGVAGDYRATMKRDGHIVNARVVGGARTKAFDDAVLAAIRAVGDSQAAPPFVEHMRGDTIELRISVRPASTLLQRAPGQPPEARGEPLFAMRVPSLGSPSAEATPDPKNPHPRYPTLAIKGKADGSTIAEFIVLPDGRVDVGSLQFLSATAVEFVSSVLEIMPDYRYTPLSVNGCPVATIQRQWFKFDMLR